MNERKQYIANCIERILRSECHVRNLRRRDEDLAEAVVIAGEHGIMAAHAYLIDLNQKAEGGCYAASNTSTYHHGPEIHPRKH